MTAYDMTLRGGLTGEIWTPAVTCGKEGASASTKISAFTRYLRRTIPAPRGIRGGESR